MLYDAGGKLYQTKQITTQVGQPQFIKFNNLPLLATGMYTLKYDDGSIKKSLRILKQ